MNAFQQFELISNPQISELAPGIYRAMVTTLMGLAVSVPLSSKVDQAKPDDRLNLYSFDVQSEFLRI